MVAECYFVFKTVVRKKRLQSCDMSLSICPFGARTFNFYLDVVG